MLVTPCSSGVMMPYDVPVTQPGSARCTRTRPRGAGRAHTVRWRNGCRGVVHVDRALGRAGGAAGEVQQRTCRRAGGSTSGASGRPRHPASRSRACRVDARPASPHDDDVLERGRSRGSSRSCAGTALGGDQHLRLRDADPGGDRLRTERREQRRDDAAVFQAPSTATYSRESARPARTEPVTLAHAERRSTLPKRLVSDELTKVTSCAGLLRGGSETRPSRGLPWARRLTALCAMFRPPSGSPCISRRASSTETRDAAA